jgi:hypothetical protein
MSYGALTVSSAPGLGRQPPEKLLPPGENLPVNFAAISPWWIVSWPLPRIGATLRR